MSGLRAFLWKVDTLELRTYLDILRRRWWLMLLVPALTSAAAFGLTKQQTPVYSATATVLVNLTQVAGTVQYNDVLTSERLTNTYAELVERSDVLVAARTTMGLSMTEDELADKISVVPVANTQLLRISAQDPDPWQAARIANGVAQAFVNDNANQLSVRPGTVSITNRAKIPLSPSSPNLRLNVLLGGMMGLMLASLIVAVQEYLDDTVKTADDIESVAGLHTLGTVSRFRQRGKKRVSVFEHSQGSEVQEAFRQLRTNVHFARLAGPFKQLLVTSSTPGEGKSTTVANLAIAIAQAGETVIVVDTDLRRPTQQTLFDVHNSFGLTGILLSRTESPETGLISTGIKGLRVLPSGPLPPNPSELLTSPTMRSLMKDLTAMADYVIYDSPPLLAVTDASILAAETDGTILVVDTGRTRTGTLRSAVKALELANARKLGVVINKVKRSRQHGYYYGEYATKSAQPVKADNVQSVAHPSIRGQS